MVLYYKKQLKESLKQGQNLFNSVLDQLPNLNVKIQSISHNSIFEIDSLEDLQHLHNVLGYSQYQSDK